MVPTVSISDCLRVGSGRFHLWWTHVLAEKWRAGNTCFVRFGLNNFSAVTSEGERWYFFYEPDGRHLYCCVARVIHLFSIEDRSLAGLWAVSR